MVSTSVILFHRFNSYDISLKQNKEQLLDDGKDGSPVSPPCAFQGLFYKEASPVMYLETGYGYK